MRRADRLGAGRVGMAVLGSIALLAGGCGGGFFVDPAKTTTPATSGNYVYVVNQTTNSLSEYVVGSSVLTLVTGSPIGLATGLVAGSVAVSRPNTYVYVGGTGAIVCYSIGSGGALTLVSAGGITASASFVSLETSPDGKWLLGLDSITQQVYVYAINTGTGALTLNSTTTYNAPGTTTVAPRMVRISPSGNVVMVALGTGGDVVFTFNTTTGVLSQSGSIALTTYSDNAIAFTANSAYVYVARGSLNSSPSGVASYSVTGAGVLTQVQTLATSGSAPFSVLLNSTGGYAYVANRGSSTISGYSVASGSLTELTGSPYASGNAVTALAADNSGKYVIAAASGGSSDLTLYGFDAVTAGRLNALAVYTSGSDPAGSIALATTH